MGRDLPLAKQECARVCDNDNDELKRLGRDMRYDACPLTFASGARHLFTHSLLDGTEEEEIARRTNPLL